MGAPSGAPVLLFIAGFVAIVMQYLPSHFDH
jgi:hypothetical protein